jgi:nucleoside-diphosphate-sugar epimerase
MKVLFGSTGLIGSALQEQTNFDRLYSSKNFRDIVLLRRHIDHLVLCCLPATKWKINQDPLADLRNIISIVDALTNVHAERITLISTIDVYGHGKLSMCEADNLLLKQPDYGGNRLLFERLIRAQSRRTLVQIIRLPALFHRLIKKNILFDLKVFENKLYECDYYLYICIYLLLQTYCRHFLLDNIRNTP